MGGPNVTIVCPVYNDEFFVGQAIQSVIEQTYSDFKFVILDNGSTDSSLDIIHSYRDSRIRVLRSDLNLRSELSAKLMFEADTEYVCQMYSDDLYAPVRIETMLNQLDRGDQHVCFSNNYFIDDGGVRMPSDQVPPTHFAGDVSSLSRWQHLRHFLDHGNSLHPVSMLIRSELYKSLGGFKSYLHQIGDMAFFARLLMAENPVFMPETLQGIRIRSRGRLNESALVEKTMRRLSAERIALLREYSSPEGLKCIDKIFIPDISDIAIPDSLRKWFLAQTLLRVGEPEFRFMSVQLMYEALEESPEAIRDNVAAITGSTVGEYMWKVNSGLLSADQMLALSVSAKLASSHEMIGSLKDQLLKLQQDYARADRDFHIVRESASANEATLAIVTEQLTALRLEHEAALQENAQLRVFIKTSTQARMTDD